jgi:transcriptional regulator with XRE-family HTH domain
MDSANPWISQSKVLGEYIRSQRQLAKLSLRELAVRTAVSNPYLSQIERGLHEPSLRVLKAIAEALDLSADVFLAQAGLLAEQPCDPNPTTAPSTPAAIRTDPTLTEAQKAALLALYHSYQDDNERSGRRPSDAERQPPQRATKSRRSRRSDD